MIDLTGRVALITGGSRGIGRACAMRFAEAGADVIVNYISSKSAAVEVAEEIEARGRRAYVIKADVSEEDDVTSMIDFVQDNIGQLDVHDDEVGRYFARLGERIAAVAHRVRAIAMGVE